MHIIRGTILIVSLSFLTSCASLLSRSNWPFYIDTNPTGAQISITNRNGVEVYKGKTPKVIKLRSGAGFFKKESYIISLSMNGYETKKINVACKLNGWYFGNIVLGGLLGFLIIDPATGAMYKLDGKGITENMEKQSAITTATLNIMDINNIPQDWATHLVKVN